VGGRGVNGVVNDYNTLPTVYEAQLMSTWTECPVHHEKVGLSTAGVVVGKCSGCMGEAARGIRFIESRDEV
jgi:hypothetical protein